MRNLESKCKTRPLLLIHILQNSYVFLFFFDSLTAPKTYTQTIRANSPSPEPVKPNYRPVSPAGTYQPASHPPPSPSPEPISPRGAQTASIHATLAVPASANPPTSPSPSSGRTWGNPKPTSTLTNSGGAQKWAPPPRSTPSPVPSQSPSPSPTPQPAKWTAPKPVTPVANPSQTLNSSGGAGSTVGQKPAWVTSSKAAPAAAAAAAPAAAAATYEGVCRFSQSITHDSFSSLGTILCR